MKMIRPIYYSVDITYSVDIFGCGQTVSHSEERRRLVGFHLERTTWHHADLYNNTPRDKINGSITTSGCYSNKQSVRPPVQAQIKSKIESLPRYD